MSTLLRIVTPIIAALLIVVLVFGSAGAAFGQNNGALLPALPPSFLNASGLAAAAGRLCTTVTGTSTSLATYSNATLTSALPNPIVLDATGRPTTNGSTRTAIYIIPGRSYRVTLYAAGTGNTCNGTSVGAQIWQQDNVYDFGGLSVVDNIRLCDRFLGSTAGAKIAACIADLPSQGGIADARGITGNQTISQNVWSGVSKPVRLMLGVANFSTSVTQEIACDGCSMIGSGTSTQIAGAATRFIWTGSVNGTVIKYTANGQYNVSSDFMVDGDLRAGIGIDVTGVLLGTSSQANYFLRVSVIDVADTTPGYCWHVGGSDNPDVSQTVFDRIVAKNCGYGIYQEGSQTVANRYRDVTFALASSGSHTWNSHMYVAGGDVTMDNCFFLGPTALGQVYVAPAALWARFNDAYHENNPIAAETTATPAYKFASGSRPYPSYIRGARIQWNLTDPGNRIVDWSQNDLLTLEDNTFGTDSSPAGAGVIYLHNGSSGTGRVIWSNNKINGATISVSIGSSTSVTADSSAQLCYSGASTPCPNSITGPGNFDSVIFQQSQAPAHYLSQSAAAANNRTWEYWVSGEQLEFNLVNDARNSRTNWLRVNRTANTVDEVMFPQGMQTTSTKIGSSGSTITAHYSATASLNFAAWAGTDCQDLTITVTGAADGNTVELGVVNALAATGDVQFTGFVSGSNTVTVRGCKISAGASGDPGAVTVRADVWAH